MGPDDGAATGEPLAGPLVERLVVLGEIAGEIAHELHNVLQIISSSAYVARQALEHDDAAAARPHVAKIERHARIAHGIVDDLMALARGEPLRCEATELEPILTSARSDFVPGAATWRDAIEPPALELRAHGALLARLLHVLYENAIQASAPRAPVVTTRAWSDGGHVVLEVGDDGPGVPPALAKAIFAPLVTARAGGGGTGLGLALARRIATAHGGTIALTDSEDARHRGATFRIELPPLDR